MKKFLSIFSTNLVSFLIGAVGVNKKIKKKLNAEVQMSNKHFELYIMMSQWVKIKQEGKNLATFFEKKVIKILLFME